MSNNGKGMRGWYLSPVTSGLAAYYYSHTVTHPSAYIGLGVFFTAASIVLITRSIVIADADADASNPNLNP